MSVFVNFAVAESPENTVVGTWKLVKYADTAANGKVTYPWGTEPSGILIYDSARNMAVQIQRTPLLKIGSTAESKLTRSTKVAMLESYTAYFGKYSVDWQKMTITHFVEGNLFPFYNGTAQIKSFELIQDRLTLRVEWVEKGIAMKGVRVFERSKP
ncbi:MAG: lipocalin-like domain-containing protein [Pyrinomonadaceae bacterium]